MYEQHKSVNLLIGSFGEVKGKLIIVMIETCEYNKRYKEITELFDNEVFKESYNSCNNCEKIFLDEY